MIYKPDLIFGDFFTQYENHLYNKSIDLCLFDLPYGIFTKNNKLSNVIDPKININALNQILDKKLTITGTVLLFCNLDLLISLKESLKDFDFRYEHIFYKPNGMYVKNQPLKNVEYLAVFKRKGIKASDLIFNGFETGIFKNPYTKKNKNQEHSTRHIIKRAIDQNLTGQRHIKQAIEMPSKCNFPKSERTPHPFQKSIKTIEMLIKVYSNEHALICDAFVGSGTTLEAAQKLNRRSIGFEIEHQWIEVCKERLKLVKTLQNLTPQKG